MRRAAVRASACLVGVVALVVPACSLGEGSGDITGTLNVPQCWSGSFALHPDFFAGVPYNDTLTIRIQNGSDYETFSDGLTILVDDVHAVRGDRATAPLLGKQLRVTIPPSVTPPGVPIGGIL